MMDSSLLACPRKKEVKKKKNERNPSDERQREIGEARFVWRCPQSPPPHSACRVLLFPAAQSANTIFLSNKPNRRLFLQEKKNLIEICINSICGPWRQWKRFFFLGLCIEKWSIPVRWLPIWLNVHVLFMKSFLMTSDERHDTAVGCTKNQQILVTKIQRGKNEKHLCRHFETR